MPLKEYRAKRDFSKTSEPDGRSKRVKSGSAYLIQKHAARRLHYDFRLQLGDTLKSWAVTRGPSLDPKDRRLAVHVEDHPLAYGSFEGTIPKGEYGGGTVMLWDHGTWEPIGDAAKDYKDGKLKFILHGERLRGAWMLVRMKPRSPRDKDNWLLIKEHDDEERPGNGDELLETENTSAVSGRSMDEIANADGPEWHSSKPDQPTAKPAKKPSIDPSKVKGAKRAKLATHFSPQLATISTKAPAGAKWLHEIKFDGYRVMASIDRGNVRMLTRNGLDWTSRLPTLARALGHLGVTEALVDGEVVVTGEDGVSRFGALQQAFSDERDDEMSYYLFDLLHLDGYDITAAPLIERRAALAKLLAGAPDGPIRFSDHLADNGPSFFQHSCRFGLEGIISKRIDAPYQPGRTQTWLKSKCLGHEEMVIGGFTKPSTGANGIGALLVGYHDADGKLIYAGKVGTGFTEKLSFDLRKQLDRLKSAKSPFASVPSMVAKQAIPVEPTLVAQIEFTAWTEDGMLRHAVFKGLREDKPANEVTRDDQPKKRSRSMDDSQASVKPDQVAGVTITHPDRVLPSIGTITKLGLAQYYADVAEWMLPRIANRPLSLLRCPGDAHQGCFFQKHVTGDLGHHVGSVEIKEDDGSSLYPVVRDIEELIALVQYGVVEFHPWGAKTSDPDAADQIIFDFDPGPGTTWSAVLDAAREMRERLDRLGLVSFVKTTGGKGLHVIAPLNPTPGWEEAKEFAHSLATEMAGDDPARYLAVSTKAKREGRIFIDYLRNGRGSTAVAAYSVRARPGGAVAMPIAWDELAENLHADHYSTAAAMRRLKSLDSDPWQEFDQIEQALPSSAPKKKVRRR